MRTGKHQRAHPRNDACRLTAAPSRPWKLFSRLLEALNLAYAGGAAAGLKGDGLSPFRAGEGHENKNKYDRSRYIHENTEDMDNLPAK